MGRKRESAPEGAPQPGDVLTVRIESLVFGGAGMGRLPDGRVLFAYYAAPGELVEATVERSYADYSEAATTRVLESSPDRVEPHCPLFGECGGCQLQHMSYPAQLAAKERMVREQLRRIGRLDDAIVHPIVGAANPWGYRNHLRFSTGKKFGDIGFISRRRKWLMKVEHCPIADPWVNEVLPKLQGKGSGLHQVQVRHNATTGSYLISPAITGLDVTSGQKSYLETLAGHQFAVSADAFFQVNGAQAEAMVRLVGGSLPERGQLLVDAFAGVGTFAAIYAGRFSRVIAIEESANAARDARTNIARTPNVSIRTGKVEDTLPLLEVHPDVVLLDPPRPGCAPPVLSALIEFRPSVVVYVSCNPATLARDLRVLVDGGYHVDHVTPLDMFPQTGHVECVSRLSLVDPGV